MARPKEFDEEQAVLAAMRVFWSAGYEGTSTEQLCAATGLGRSSVYNTFTSKHHLFELALDRYMRDKDASAKDLLTRDLPTREKIRALLWFGVEPDADEPVGCFVVNSGVELAPRDPVVAAQLDRNYAERVSMLCVTFEAGIRAGEIDAGRAPVELAHFVMATITGMRVMARAGAERAVLAAVANTALRAI